METVFAEFVVYWSGVRGAMERRFDGRDAAVKFASSRKGVVFGVSYNPDTLSCTETEIASYL
jgi:hypothetical protein